MGVVVRRYIHFLILLIPTPLVSALFGSNIPNFLFIYNRHVNSHALRVRHTHLDINSRSHAKSRKSHALPRVLSLSSAVFNSC